MSSTIRALEALRATLEIRLEDSLKKRESFSSLGLDISTAVRIFLNAAIEYKGIPFPVCHKVSSLSLQEAISDSRNRKNLYGPFDSAETAVASMMED